MFKFLRRKIGIIGYGNMGSAIAERIKDKYRVLVIDKDKQKTECLVGIGVAANIYDLLKNVDVVMLTVKPQDFDELLKEIKDKVDNRLIISIAAGITTKYIENILGMIKIIRVMPNIGVIVGQGISYICKGEFAKEKDLRLSVKIFKSIGYTFIFAEDLMNAATAVGGSGPGFWGYLLDKMPANEWNKYESDYFIPQFTSAAKSVGFDDKIARLTATLVTTGSNVTANTLHITPGELAKKVASKGGTTEAGLEVLLHGGSLTEAVKAAKKRAEELSKKE